MRGGVGARVGVADARVRGKVRLHDASARPFLVEARLYPIGARVCVIGARVGLGFTVWTF